MNTPLLLTLFVCLTKQWKQNPKRIEGRWSKPVSPYTITIKGSAGLRSASYHVAGTQTGTCRRNNRKYACCPDAVSVTITACGFGHQSYYNTTCRMKSFCYLPVTFASALSLVTRTAIAERSNQNTSFHSCYKILITKQEIIGLYCTLTLAKTASIRFIAESTVQKWTTKRKSIIEQSCVRYLGRRQ